MMGLKAISYMHFSVVIMRISSSSGVSQSENPVKILNTENIILTMRDLSGESNEELELLRTTSEGANLSEKLEEFHRAIAQLKTPERLGMSNTVTWKQGPKSSETHSIPHDDKLKKKRLKWFRRLKSKKYYWKNSWRISKRDAVNGETRANNLNNEYDEFIAKSRRNNTYYRYTDEGKPEENFKDVVSKLIDFGIPSNCTNISGIGIQAIECILRKGNANEITQLEMYQRIMCILLAWFCIYLGVAVPFWCIKGWCCCCFRCWFCFPNRTVKEMERFVRECPPGVYVNPKGEHEHYCPNAREVELYEKIKLAIEKY